MNNITILDTTLRDGAQAEGISFSVNDKLSIMQSLDELGISVIEAGNPYSNQKEMDFFLAASEYKLKNAKLCAFGSTRRKGIKAKDDQNCQALLSINTPIVSIVGKSNKQQVNYVLQTSLEENLLMIEETCRLMTDNGRTVIFDAEHFFDGFTEDANYAIETLRAAERGGAKILCLCDTNGGTMTSDVSIAVSSICDIFQDIDIGVHLHNDCDMATASSVMAVLSGAVHVQGTFLGFGERCGNANLSSVIPNLQIKYGFNCIPENNMSFLTPTAIKIAETANVTLQKNMPFVGRSAFAHKGGMHVDGVIKEQSSFEHIDPDIIGNRRRFLMSEFTGKAAILRKIKKLYPDFDGNTDVTSDILNDIKQREYDGYQYEGAESSLDLIIHRYMDSFKPFFDLVSYKVLDELPYDNNHSATATIKLKVDGTQKIAASDGDGPVNALDTALRAALTEFYPCLNRVRLIDYKVRVIEPKFATAAKVRVLITSSDGDEIWTTVGISEDIIEASWLALVDSIEHMLLKNLK